MTNPTTPIFDLAFAADWPRQQDFLSRVAPALARLPQVHALWLTGSLARDDADRWSSVDLCLLVTAGDDRRWTAGKLRAAVADALDQNVSFSSSHIDALGGGSLSGMTLAAPLNIATSGGVSFGIYWDAPARVQSLRAWHGPVRLLYAADTLPPDTRTYLEHDFFPLAQCEDDYVEGWLALFWREFFDLPAVVNRGEHLAAAGVLERARSHLINLIVAVNGARRPPSSTRINQYLGPSQREALEKTLAHQTLTPDVWIGQAVALIIIYRWYAPQLLELFPGLPYPARLEETVLALLAAEIDGWPARITTG